MAQRQGQRKGKSETRYCYDCGEQGHIGVNCPNKWANSFDEEHDQTSSWESEPEGENAEELASLETHDVDGEWCCLRRAESPGGRRRIDSRPAVHYLAEGDEDEQASRGLNHLAARNAGISVDVEEGHRGGGLRSSRECEAEEHVPEIGIRQTERSKNGKGFKGVSASLIIQACSLGRMRRTS